MNFEHRRESSTPYKNNFIWKQLFRWHKKAEILKQICISLSGKIQIGIVQSWYFENWLTRKLAARKW